MIITVRRRRFTVGSAIRQFFRDYWQISGRLLVQILFGTLAVLLLSLIGRFFAMGGMIVLLLILFLRESRSPLCFIVPDSRPSRAATTLATALAFSSSVYVSFFLRYSEAFLTRAWVFLAVPLSAALLVCLFRMVFFWRPGVFDDQTCPECGVSMERLSCRWDSEPDEYELYGPGQVIRRSGGVQRITRLRCPNCKAGKTNVV